MVNNNHDLIIISDPTERFCIAGDGLLPHTGPGLAPGPQPGMGIFAMMGEGNSLTSQERLRLAG